MQSLFEAPQAIEPAALTASREEETVRLNVRPTEPTKPPLPPFGDQQQFDFGF
jgi:hypothetical protein